MNKCVIYAFDNKLLYKKMLLNSISMLRRHNKTIKVFVLLVRFEPDTFFVDFLAKNNVESVKIDSDYSYFQNNKKFFSKVDCLEYLVLDCDTFIFVDVENIFSFYSDFDMVAVENDWVRRRSYPDCEVKRVFNSGVFYGKKDFLNYFCQNIESRIADFEQMKYPKVCEWLLTVDKNMYNKEEFAFSSLAEGFNCRFFDGLHCRHPKSNSDLNDFSNTTIFHSFSANWKRFLSAANKRNIKLFKFVGRGS